MDETIKQTLFENLRLARSSGKGSFAQRYRTPENMARMAYNSSIIEGREVSFTRLQEAAAVLLKTTSK